MAAWERHDWMPADDPSLPRRERRTGEYWSYCPTALQSLSLQIEPETSRLLARAEASVLALAAKERSDLLSISRYLLRSEAIASSQIEGIAPSPQRIALAELGQYEAVSGLSEAAVLVANNMTIVKEATGRLTTTEELTVSDLVDLQRALLPENPRLHGVRTRQNWVGGSQWHPLDAEFVPPHPDHVPDLLDDLIAYVNGGAHAPLVQAALAHAQFETIHPFADGNGRVGRALIHTVLARRGLTVGAVLPVSLVLATHSDAYISGLSGFRAHHEDSREAATLVQEEQLSTDPSSGRIPLRDAPNDVSCSESRSEASNPGGRPGLTAWLRVFAEAVLQAAEHATDLADELAAMRAEWDGQLEAWRTRSGRTRALRSDSAVFSILRDLPATPVLTAATVRRIHGCSDGAAMKALDSLQEAEVLSTLSIGKGRRAFVSNDVLNLITVTERKLASTRFDTRLSPPSRPAPAPPVQ